MPVTKSAKKKLRQDKKRTSRNQKSLNALKKAVKSAEKKKSGDLSHLFSMIDKAVKNNLIHKNKAARMKSQLSKTVKNTANPKATTVKPAAKTVAKPKITKSPAKKS